MTTRHITPSMIYIHSAPARWLHSLTAARDETAARVCRAYWQQGAIPARSTVPIGQGTSREHGQNGSIERSAR